MQVDRFPLTALAGPALVAALYWAEALPLGEALSAGLAYALCAFLTRELTGLKRLGLDLLLLSPVYVLTLTLDSSQRLMLFQALLSLTLSLLVIWREQQRHHLRPWEWALAAGVPLISALPSLFIKFGWLASLGLVVPVAGWILARLWGFWALPLTWLLFSPLHPGVLAGTLALTPLFSRKPWDNAVTGLTRRWAVSLFAAGLVAPVLLPFGGALSFPGWFLPGQVYPKLAALLVTTAFLRPGLAAATWAWGFWVLLPTGPTPPDRPGPTLMVTAPTAELPPGEAGSLYQLEVALTNAGLLLENTPVAYLDVGGTRITLRAGRDAVEWASLREDVAKGARHGLPQELVFRPSLSAPWAVAGRLELFVPPGEKPIVTRNPGLPPSAEVHLLQAGPGKPTARRSWNATEVLLAALVFATLLLPGYAKHPGAAAPFGLLALAKLWLWLPLQPSRILIERHGVSLALAIGLAAWGLAFQQWLRKRQVALPALVLLVFLAFVAPHIFPLAGDEPYHLAVAESLKTDGDLDITNNVDSQRYPRWIVEAANKAKGRFLHSPVLAFLLFPSYFVGGRVAMVLTVAFLSWLMLIALQHRGEQLGFSPLSCLWGLILSFFSYPFVLFSFELSPEIPAAAAVSWQLVWAAGGNLLPSAAVAITMFLVKARLGLVAVPLVGGALLGQKTSMKRVFLALGAAAVVGTTALALAALWFGNPLDPLGRRALSHLVPRSLGQPVRVIFGLIFDSAYGVSFTAPLWLGALLGLPLLWRRGGPGERALILGGGATVAALLSYVEWRGGESVPFRYLVVLLPFFFLSLLASWRKATGRMLTILALPPTAIGAWVALTQPSLLYNIGDGGHWLADRLSARLAADVRHLFPSYLRLSAASWLTPVIVILLAAGLVWLGKCKPQFRRWLCRQGVGLWLVAGAALVATARHVPDRVVELEDPQVQHVGGSLEPNPGTWTRFLYPNGWRIGGGDNMTVPLHLPTNRGLKVVGWAEDLRQGSCRLTYKLVPSGIEGEVMLPTDFRSGLTLPAISPGRFKLTLAVGCPPGVTVVLDRLEVVK